jgi:hypothetical protein
MFKKEKNWHIIFNDISNHFVFIYYNEIKELLSFIQYFEEIEKNKDFITILRYDVTDDSSFYLQQYSPILKKFFETDKKETLIIEEFLLQILIKEDKLENFFKYILKKNKKIVLFSQNSYLSYIQNIAKIDYSEQLYKDWFSNISLFDRFYNIKIAIEKTNNPFKNPLKSKDNH